MEMVNYEWFYEPQPSVRIHYYRCGAEELTPYVNKDCITLTGDWGKLTSREEEIRSKLTDFLYELINGEKLPDEKETD